MTETTTIKVGVKADPIPREILVSNHEEVEVAPQSVMFVTQKINEVMTLGDIAKALFVHYDTLSKWRQGSRIPDVWKWSAMLRLALIKGVLEKDTPSKERKSA